MRLCSNGLIAGDGVWMSFENEADYPSRLVDAGKCAARTTPRQRHDRTRGRPWRIWPSDNVAAVLAGRAPITPILE